MNRELRRKSYQENKKMTDSSTKRRRIGYENTNGREGGMRNFDRLRMK